VRARRLLFWIHLITGCFAGLVILFLAITGTLLAYERPLIAAADGGHRVPSCTAVAGEALNAAMAQAQANHLAVSAIAVHRDPALPIDVTVGRNPSHVLLINPCTGAYLGDSAPRLRHFFETVTGLHRWFGLADASRATARAVKGGFTFALAFLVVSGFVLWWPRRWNRHGLSQSMLYQRRLRGRGRWWNWHNATGFWIALPLLTICLTGVVMAYPWATNLLYRLTGSPLPEQRASEHRAESAAGEHGRPKHDHVSQPVNWDSLFATAEQQIPGWRSAMVQMRDASGSDLTIEVDRGDGGRPDLRTQVVLEKRSGRVLRVEGFSSYSRGRQLRMWARFVHTGEAGGLFGETIAAIASLGAVVLVITGFMLSGRRFLSRKRARTESAKEAVQQPLMPV
jgi:uncharacterized iron-regulated membrane protein